jgi:NAD(P)-dependent dehydrogenase (short-subunit alcohol dehydrogenase family)
MQSSSSQIALVTGANKGIGLEIVGTLARKGMRVLLGARNAKLGGAAAAQLQEEGLDVQFIELDLGRPETLRDAAAWIEKHAGKLDVLVNNAGIAVAGDGPPTKADIDIVRRVFETNFFGTLAVTQAMLPLVRATTPPRPR